jgi:putative ABC transport system permease protein
MKLLINFTNSLREDLRYSLRTLHKSPGFTVVAIITLAVGIGANTAIFSVVNAVLLQPLAYKDPGRLVVVLHDGRNPVAPANFIDWRNQSTAFERMGAAEYWTPNLTSGDRPEKLWALQISADILPLLGVEPALGRVFLPEEDNPGRNHEVILSYALWQRRFSGDESVLGRPIVLNGETYTVVGVMPRGFKFAPFWATKAELWAPLAFGARADSRNASSLRIFARLAPGISLEQARAVMATITGRLDSQFPGTNRNVTVVPLKERVVGDIRPALIILLGAVALVLLIACANVAHMMLARASARQKEIAVRIALGASRLRLIRQFLTESLIVAMLGGGTGLLLAIGCIRLLASVSSASIPRSDSIGIDVQVLIFIAALSILTGLGFGLVPAFQSSSSGPGDALKEAGRSSGGGMAGRRVRGVLVASEFSLALMLLIGAGLMVRSFVALHFVDPGFNPKNLVTMVVSVAGSKESGSNQRAEFYKEMRRRVRAMAGIQSAGVINHLPLAGDIWGWPFWIEGEPLPEPGAGPVAVYRVVLPGYFQAMEIPIVSGRDFDDTDTTNTAGVVIINQRLADRYWPGQNAVGKRISLDSPQKKPSWLTIVGVVRNSKQDEWAAHPESEVFLPYLQNHYYLEASSTAFGYMTLVARTTADAGRLASAIESQIWSIDPTVTISEVQTMADVVANSTAGPRFNLLLLGAFAGIALILAAVGIYGVTSYSVSRRTHEVGIRMALGAGRQELQRLIVGQAMVLALVGASTGLAGSLGLARLMSRLLYGVQPTDAATFLVVTVVLCGVALVSAYIPARRATRIDPMTALRCE